MGLRRVLVINKPYFISEVKSDRRIISIGNETIQEWWAFSNVFKKKEFLDRMIHILSQYTLFISEFFLREVTLLDNFRSNLTTDDDVFMFLSAEFPRYLDNEGMRLTSLPWTRDP